MVRKVKQINKRWEKIKGRRRKAGWDTQGADYKINQEVNKEVETLSVLIFTLFSVCCCSRSKTYYIYFKGRVF